VATIIVVERVIYKHASCWSCSVYEVVCILWAKYPSVVKNVPPTSFLDHQDGQLYTEFLLRCAFMLVYVEGICRLLSPYQGVSVGSHSLSKLKA
jgi:hypothetical protein